MCRTWQVPSTGLSTQLGGERYSAVRVQPQVNRRPLECLERASVQVLVPTTAHGFAARNVAPTLTSPATQKQLVPLCCGCAAPLDADGSPAASLHAHHTKDLTPKWAHPSPV